MNPDTLALLARLGTWALFYLFWGGLGLALLAFALLVLVVGAALIAIKAVDISETTAMRTKGWRVEDFEKPKTTGKPDSA